MRQLYVEVIDGSRNSYRHRRNIYRYGRVREEDALAVRHPQSYPAWVAVTLRNGLTADYLSDGRSPSPDWHWDPLLTKARAVAVRVGVEERIDPLRAAIIAFSDSGQFIKAVLPAL